jgi:hypothetical protein
VRGQPSGGGGDLRERGQGRDLRERGQGDLELVTAGGETSAWRARRQAGGGGAADLGLDGVVQTELQAAAEVVPETEPQVGPSVGGDHQVQAVVQAASGQRLDLSVEVGKFLPEPRPVVDDQEDLAVAVPARGRLRGPAGMPVGHRGDLLCPELLFALGDDGTQLADHPSGSLRILDPRDGADVR